MNMTTERSALTLFLAMNIRQNCVQRYRLSGCYVSLRTAWKREYFVRQNIDSLMFHAALHNSQSLNEVPCCCPGKLKSMLTIPTQDISAHHRAQFNVGGAVGFMHHYDF